MRLPPLCPPALPWGGRGGHDWFPKWQVQTYWGYWISKPVPFYSIANFSSKKALWFRRKNERNLMRTNLYWNILKSKDNATEMNVQDFSWNGLKKTQTISFGEIFVFSEFPLPQLTGRNSCSFWIIEKGSVICLLQLPVDICICEFVPVVWFLCFGTRKDRTYSENTGLGKYAGCCQPSPIFIYGLHHVHPKSLLWHLFI